MRLRRSALTATAAVIGALVVAACGGSSNSSDQTGGGGQQTVTVTRTVTQTQSTATHTETGPLTNTTATQTKTTPAALGNACSHADLTASYLGSNGAAGTIVLGFALKNTGSTTCHTYGWPGVQFLSSSGAALPTNAKRTTGDVVGATPANVLTLKPGEEASFRLVASDMGPNGSSCPTASQLQIYPPDDTITLKVGLSGVAACGSATLSPMMPGASAFDGQGGGGGQGSGGGATTSTTGGAGPSSGSSPSGGSSGNGGAGV